MEVTVAPLWFLAGLVALWLGFRLSHSMHEGAADSRAPLTARTLVTVYCGSVTAICSLSLNPSNCPSPYG